MWKIVPSRRFDSLSMRRITLFVSAVLMALLTTIVLSTTIAKAQTTTNIDAMATWSGENLQYATVTLEKRNRPDANDPAYPNLAGTACENSDTLYYSSIRESPSTPDVYWLYVICFKPGFSSNDKSKQIDATMLNYSLPKDSQDVRGGAFNRVSSLDIKIAPEGTDALGQDTTGKKSTSTCDGDGTIGIGWIVCPLTNWLASGMDQLFVALKGFLTVSPISTDRGSAHYYMWDVMRNFANILFIIGFLFIIYSQITNVGISNYGLKRLLPRLIIAAVLVNVSYWIAAVAVDISNILGNSLHNLFTDIGNKIPETAKINTNINASEVSWRAIAASVLSGGAAAFVVGGAVVGTFLSAGASLWFLLVGLMTAMVSVLVAILVMAVRQALITILVIVSPLAFVAYLLPSTEKYFDRWKDLFITMLLVFPIVSVVFGGSQLAGLAIIYSADPSDTNGHYFNLIILGMLVQVAPVIITPLLIKLSGSLVGRIAGIVNNPNKGLIDKTRKFSQTRHDMTKNRQLWDKDQKTGKYKNNNLLAAAGRRGALRETNNSHKLKAWEGGLAAAYEQDHRSHDVYKQSAINDILKTSGENDAKASFARDVAQQAALRRMFTQQQINQEDAELASTINKTTYELGRTKPASESDIAIKGLYDEAAKLSTNKRKETMRQSSITGIQEDSFYGELDNSEAMMEYAGAKEVDPYGDLRAKVIAQSKLMATSSERVKNYKQSFVFDNIDKDTALKKATREIYTNDEEWEAAINYVFESKDTDNIIKLHEQIHLTKETPVGIRQAFEYAAKNSPTKPIFASSSRLGRVAQGIDLRDDGDGMKLTDEWQLEAAMSNKYSTADLVRKASKEEIGRLAKLLERDGKANLRRFSREQRAALHDAVRETFKDGRYRAEMGDREKNLRKLGEVLDFTRDDYNLRVRS